MQHQWYVSVLILCLVCTRGTFCRSLLGSSFSLLSGSNRFSTWPSSSGLTGSTRRPAVWQPFTNSPMYYIKLAPSAAKSQIQSAQGLGFVNPPKSSPHRPFFSVPFKANGRPSSLYALSSSSSSSSSTFSTTTSRPVKIKPTNSPIKWLPGKFSFDGKPSSTVSVFKSALFQSLFGKLMNSQDKTATAGHDKPKHNDKRRNSKFDMFMWNRDEVSRST